MVWAAYLGIPIPGGLGSVQDPEAKTPAVVDRVLGAEVTAATTAPGQDLFQFAAAEGTGPVRPIPVALARPLALVAGQVVGGKSGAFGAGIGPKNVLSENMMVRL